MKRYLIVGLIPLLGACAYPIKPEVINSVEDSRAMIAMARAQERARAVEAKEHTRQQVYSRLDDRDLILAYQSDAMRDMSTALVSVLRAESHETNFYDFAIVDSREANATRRSGITTGAYAGVTAFGIDRLANVMDTALTSAGTKTITNIKGDGNSTSHTNYDTRANIRNDLGSRGDNSPVTANNPPVTGPDQSSTVEITEAVEAVEAAGP